MGQTSDNDTLDEDLKEAKSGWRYVSVGLIFMIVNICYADRTNIGIVLANQDFEGIPHEDKGSILSAFFVGYIFSQIPGGMIAQRWGAKPSFLLAAFVWTVADALTPVLAHVGFKALILGRIAMGLGEGLVFPTQHTFVNFWVPRHERAFLICVMTGGQEFGSVLANIISPQLLQSGVVYVFVFWALASVAWIFLFTGLAASAPELHAQCIRSGEAAWIQEHREAPHIHDVQRARVKESPCPSRLLRQRCVWAIFVGHAGNNYGWYVVLSWMPTFYSQKYELNLASNPHLLAIPYVAGFVGVLIVSRISDKLISRGIRTRRVRKIVQAMGAMGFAVFLLLASSAASPEIAGVWMTLALFFGRMQTAGFWVNMADVCPDSAGTVMGLSNTLATIPGIVGQPITQSVLNATGSWQVVFGLGGFIAVVGAAIFGLLADDVPLDTDVVPNNDEVDLDDVTVWTVGRSDSAI